MKVICDLIVHGLLEVASTVVVVIESSLSWNVFFFYSNVRVLTAGEFALDIKMICPLIVCMACQKFALTVEVKFMMAMCVCVCVCVCMHACMHLVAQWCNVFWRVERKQDAWKWNLRRQRRQHLGWSVLQWHWPWPRL